MITLRRFTRSDAPTVRQLFYDTVHAVNKKDYTQAQLDAWAPKDADMNRWADMLEKSTAYVAECNGHIVGFGDVTTDGFLDHLYVHKDYQGVGVGKMLVVKLEEEAKKMELTELEAHVNITAKPFFERMGYHDTGTQNIRERRGHVFVNYVMKKKLA